MYKLYRRPADKVLGALGLDRLLFWRRHTYKEFWALRDINLDVGRGARLGFIGRNGAGKSTLLKIVAGNVAATEGTVEVNGRIQALMELGTGFHPEFTGRQNIRASLAFQGFRDAEIRQMEEEIVDFAELDEFIDQPVKTYSAGMYTRLAFSTATAIKPEILIIDEVLGAGDAYFAGKCLERMKQLTEASGATVLFVSHDLGSVQQLCERVIWIDHGRVQYDGKPLEVIKAYMAVVHKEEEHRLRARDARTRQRALLSPNAVTPPQAVPAETPPEASADEYGSREARIVSLRMVDDSGEESRVFEAGRPLEVRMEFESREAMPTPVFVFCAYLPDGRCATQWVASPEVHGRGGIQGLHTLVFKLDRLLLGRGDYVASAAIFKTLGRRGHEPESYHVLDRCVHFKVTQGLPEFFDLGLCVQPFRTDWDDGR